MSPWRSPDVHLSTRGCWGIGIMMLTRALITFVSYRLDDRLSEDRPHRRDGARTQERLAAYAGAKGVRCARSP